MPFVAADGLNYEDANSFVSLEYANDYFSLRGNTLWTGTDEQKEAALIKATDYIEQTYGERWIGSNYRMTGLSWPRSYIDYYAEDTIPENLKKATCELALEALTKDLNPVISTDAGIKREKVDVIETEYFEPKYDRTVRPAVMGYLMPLLGGSVYNRKVVRV